jgi:SAM-dependent methyltransferase
MTLYNSVAEPDNGVTEQKLRIIGLMRGRYVVPVLASLERLGHVKRLLSGEALRPTADDGVDQRFIRAIFSYLASLDILALGPCGYTPTPFGISLLRRAGSACILESYRAYFDRLDVLLDVADQPQAAPRVDRGLNILGSGALHRRKFFEPALRLVDPSGIEAIIDLGCGDGTFLELAAAAFSDSGQIVALDLSPEAVTAAARRLSERGFTGGISEIVANAGDIAGWSSHLPAARGRELVSAWFVLHEFCAGGAMDAVRFFAALREARPCAEVLVGEITSFTEHELAPHHAHSIAPEFLLFHALSGQSPLSWADWRHVAAEIPYTVAGELRADWVGEGCSAAPANFIWHLVPKGR